MQLKDLQAYIHTRFADNIQEHTLVRGELTFVIEPSCLRGFLDFLRDDPSCHFEVLVDVCGADYLNREKRFEVVYHLLSVKHHKRVRVKVCVDEKTPVPSVVDIYSAALWPEREAFDMYGVMFEGHPDLRRLLTDYHFEGHPLRKDFPLTGFTEVRYDEEQKRVISEPVKLTQDFRTFDFLSPWEGMTKTLPGDEKAEESA